MDREAPSHDDDHQVAPAKQQQQQADPDGDGVTTRTPGGKDALGKKENLLAPWFDEMVEVANELAPKFVPLGLHFRPEILLATAMQESANKDPLNARSFDNGLGLMQITPSKGGQLDAGVAKAIGWDNAKSLDYNMQHSKWRDAKSNLLAGAHTMLGKGVSIRSGVPKIWEQMDEGHKWRAVLFAYNAGQGNAIKALKNGGPNASMISTFTDKSGKKVSHDYTAEIKAKMDYVDSHDPFGGAGEGGDTKKDDDEDKQKPTAPTPAEHNLKKSVGLGGVNDGEDVHAVQVRLKERGVDPGAADSQIGPKTIGAIEQFQTTFLKDPDGLISPGKNTEKQLFDQSGKVTVTEGKKDADDKKPDDKKADTRNDKQTEDTKKDGPDQDGDHPTYDQIAKNFKNGIPGSGFSWHDALWLPSWGRHAKPSDVTNTDMDTVLKNIEKQAAALQKVEDHLGKKIVVHCWLRPPKYNAQIGGASNSAHLRGMATDFHVEGMSAEAVRKVVKATPDLYGGAGENNVSWNHLDLEHKKWFNP